MSACFCRFSVRKRPSSDFKIQLVCSSSETSAIESTSLFPKYSSEPGNSLCKSSQWKSAAEKVWKKLNMSLSLLMIRMHFTKLIDLSVWYRKFCLVPGIGAPKYISFLIMRSLPVSTSFFSSSIVRFSALHFANTLPVVRAACLRSMFVATKVKQWWVTKARFSRNKCWKYCFLDGFLPSLGFVMSPLPSGKRSGNALEKNPGINSDVGFSSLCGQGSWKCLIMPSSTVPTAAGLWTVEASSKTDSSLAADGASRGIFREVGSSSGKARKMSSVG